MAIKFLDGFDHYATSDLTRMWSQVYTAENNDATYAITSGGRRSSNALRIENQTQGSDWIIPARHLVPGSATCLMGFAFKGDGGNGWGQLQAEAYGANSINMSFQNRGVNDISANVVAAIRKDYYTHAAITINNNGTISAYRGTQSLHTTFVGPDRIAATYGTTVNALQYGQYYYIEMKLVIHETNGVFQLVVNGETWLSFTGVTQAAGLDSDTAWSEVAIGFHKASGVSGVSHHYWYYDDLYVADTDASDAYNQVVDLMGDVAISYANVFDDGSTLDWTPSAGSDHFAMVDDNPPDLDTTYNATQDSGDVDTFLKSAVPVVGVPVIALSPIYLARRTEGAATQSAAVIRDNGTNYSGSQEGSGESIGNTSTYTYDWWTVTQRPSNAAVALTQPLADAMEVGYKKVV